MTKTETIIERVSELPNDAPIYGIDIDFVSVEYIGTGADLKKLVSDLETLREAVNEIHKVASAGCPVGEHPDATFEAISEICAEAKL